MEMNNHTPDHSSASGSRRGYPGSVPIFEEDRKLARRIRQKLVCYERNRERIAPEDRDRITEAMVQDFVKLSREYSLDLVRKTPS